MKSLTSRYALPTVALLAALVAGCASHAPAPEEIPGFETSRRPEDSEFASTDLLARFEAETGEAYLIGPGDRLTVNVFGQPDLSGAHVVGPDGVITVDVAGPIRVTDLSRQEAASAISKKLSPFYLDAAATVGVDEYTSHRILVLGRVSQPGSIQFETTPTLLDAITRAGGLPIGGVGADKAALTRCAVFRGRDRVVWIDLKRLLRGTDLALNIKLRRGDVVYLPDADDQLVYVLGEVHTPGAYSLTPDMSFLDALSQAGGPTPDAASGKIEVVRTRENLRTVVDLRDLRDGAASPNLEIAEGDIIYVPQNGVAQAGYVIQKLAPGMMMLLFGAALAL